MAAQIYLITKVDAVDPVQTYVNDIYACLINSDDGSADAVKIAEAEAVIQGLGHPIPDGYLDTVELVGPPTAGIMTTDEDVILFLRRSTDRAIA